MHGFELPSILLQDKLKVSEIDAGESQILSEEQDF
jgi:hypothetical protein